MSEKRTLRCAVYTRKSSDEGLEQNFNSLDAQFEACAAFVASQAGEGWKLLPERYDDGGISGGTLERPALNRLLEDIRAGRVDMIVVYKIDRLTRSLADFAKLIDELERHECSFVAVTQAFNTSTSMGRLTLNVLLSFAQFEREVTAERIRDKIAASKKKGMWMGGNMPLGYRKGEDGLVIHQDEADLVRHIHDLYRTNGCLNAVEAALANAGIQTPVRTTKTGRKMGGTAFSRGQIYRILSSPLYAGWVSHKGERYDGLHDAIISRDDWHDMQTRLQVAATQRRRSRKGDGKTRPLARSLLAGKLFDENANPLVPSHTKSGKGRKRYYVSKHLMVKSGDGSPNKDGWRLPAEPLETTIRKALIDQLQRPDALSRYINRASIQDLEHANQGMRPLLDALASPKDTKWVEIIAQVTIEVGKLAIAMDRVSLANRLGIKAGNLADAAIKIEVPFSMRRRGIELKLITATPDTQIDQTLIKGIALGHDYLNRVREGASIAEMARENGWTEPLISQRIKLAFLAPDIIKAILAGQQPVDLTLDRLLRSEIPLDWAAQKKKFGFKTG